MYYLSIVTPEKTLFDGFVYSLIAPGADGYLEILTDHAPMIVLLQTGRLTVTSQEEGKKIYAISSGFLEVSHNRATLLADTIEPASEIDIERARTALQNAQQRLDSQEPGIDRPRAKSALKRAENRIKIYEDFILEKRDAERHSH